MTDFDAQAKEAALRAESESWDTSTPIDAQVGDIPVIDIARYLATGSPTELAAAASELREACETVGFWQLVGHGIEPAEIDAAFAAVRQFHDVSVEVKEQILMDRPDWPLGGVGYLPVGNRKLPARAVGNANEAFIMKGDRDVTSNDNQWLGEEFVPGFRVAVERFAGLLEQLTRDLLPIYAASLDLEPNWFAPGFKHPFTRLRMTRYPASEARAATMSDSTDLGRKSQERYGINPHVDTTFFTLLLQDSPGLTIYHTPSDRWLNVPVVDNAFVVNSGELLRQWTNDRFLSVRHFANAGHSSGDTGQVERHSIPFFVNATRDYPMECIPTCCSEDNPPKYPTISYNESQGVVQGE